MHLIFDTETTGLPNDFRAPATDTDNWPRIVQIAYQLYDDDANLVKEVDHIIRPDGFEIPEESSEIHGITTQKALEEGIDLQAALDEFFVDADRAQHLIAHNADFDTKVIDAEFIRLKQSPFVCDCAPICTMKGTVQVCKIPGPYGYKWPRLEQLHYFLFQEHFTGAHDALVDVKATAKCYFRLRDINAL